MKILYNKAMIDTKDKNDTEDIITRLKQARTAKGLRQIQMAERIEISRAGYSRIENREVQITLKNLLKIIEVLDISILWLLYGTVEDQNGLKLSDFGEYAETVQKMLKELIEDEVKLHAVLSFFFELKKNDAVKELKKIESEKGETKK